MTGRQSVELLDEIALPKLVPRQRALPAKARTSRMRHRAHGGILLGVTACHGLLGWLAMTSASGTPLREADDSLVAVFIRPRVIRAPEPERTVTLPMMLSVPVDAPRSEIPIPEIDRPTTLMAGVGMMAPRPEVDGRDPTPFARRAGLAEGQGATAVLRVEVYGTGDIGRVEVDVSGGSEQINEAAVSYVRSLSWSGGMIDGKPATIWVRIGVRLDG